MRSFVRRINRGSVRLFGSTARTAARCEPRSGNNSPSSTKQRQGSSSRIDRLLVLLEPPSLENGEITDKRSINQRRVIERCAADVATLYADPVNSSVIVPFDS